MIATTEPDWQPRDLLRIEAVRPTNMGVVLAVTDAGKAYIKPLGGSDHGPHCLACELVGTRLASWFGLPTLDHALMRLTPLDAEMIRDAGGRAEPGAAFATRAVSEASPWGGSTEELEKVANQDMIPRLVIFDTWTLNWDRCPPDGDGRGPNYDNVLLAKQKDCPGLVHMLAIDHGECFSARQELNDRIARIERKQDDRIYGLFPAFRPYIRRDWVGAATERLYSVDRDVISGWVDGLPGEWQVTDMASNALVDLICSRASYVADTIGDRLCFVNGQLF